jgi:ribosomal protein L34E
MGLREPFAPLFMPVIAATRSGGGSAVRLGEKRIAKHINCTLANINVDGVKRERRRNSEQT